LPALASALGVPVVGAVALTGRGIDVLRSAIHKRADERSAQLLQV
jgi:Fe2+ transport system protein B